MMRSESAWSTMPSRLHSTTAPESRAVTRCIPIPICIEWPRMRGTAWRCRFDHFFAALEHEVSGLAAVDELGSNLQALVKRDIGLRHHVLIFFPRGQVEAVRLVDNLAALELFVEILD